MPLESAVRPYDLNVNNPADGDPAKAGAAHLRMIKSMLKSIGLGNLSLAEAKALTAPFNTMFVYAEHLYQIQPNYIGTSGIEDTAKVIFLNNGNRAYRLDNPSWIGPYQGTEVKKPGDFTAFRYPVVVHLKHPSSSFNDSAAAAACPNGTPVVGDIVAFQTNSGIARLTEAKMYRGAGMGWIRVDIESNGDLFQFGLLAGLRVSAESSVITQMRGHKLELVGNTNMELRNPDGFGPDSLIYWFGKKDGLIDGNGEIKYDLLTKANAYLWTQVGDTGAVGGGGSSNPDLPPPATSGGDIPTGIGLADIYGSNVVVYDNMVAESYVDLVLRPDGTFVFDINGDITGFPLTGNYVTTPSANVGSLYDYRVTHISGDSLITGYPTWTSLGVTRVISQIANVSGGGGPDSKSTQFTLEIRERSNAANQEAKVLTFNVYARSYSGAAP